MKRDVEWKEKLDGGVKRTVRVCFPGHGVIKWQFKRSDDDGWDYNTPATREDWEMLLQKVEAIYNRRRCDYKEIELVKKNLKLL